MRDRSDVDAIRAALADPRDVARRLQLDRPAMSGGRWRCPAHGGASLSLTLGPDRTLRVKCFGCELAGDVFSLVAAVRGFTLPRDFGEVLREAADLASIALPELPPAPPEPAPIVDELFAAIVSRLLGLAPLRADREVRGYLAQRLVADDAARDGWGALPRGGAQDAIVARLDREFGREALLGSGLAIVDEERLRLRSPGARVLIPWRGADGSIVALQRRRIDDREPRYLATAGRPLRAPYGLDQLRTMPDAPIALVEGAMDALALRVLCARRRVLCAVLAIPGVEAWRASWAELGRGRRVYVALDADDAGDRKAVTIEADLEAAGARPKRWRPSAKDWAELLGRAG